MARSASSKSADSYVRKVIAANPNALISHYLLACYAYYKQDNPLISDALFDHITARLIAEWDSIEHPHKHLISMDDLKAGTGYAIQYPSMVPGALWSMRRALQRGELSALGGDEHRLTEL